MSVTIDQAEQIDRANAFELGFAKAAHDAGLTEEQYNLVRQLGVRLLQKQAADSIEAENRAQAEQADPAGAAAYRKAMAEYAAKPAAPVTPQMYTSSPGVPDASYGKRPLRTFENIAHALYRPDVPMSVRQPGLDNLNFVASKDYTRSPESVIRDIAESPLFDGGSQTDFYAGGVSPMQAKERFLRGIDHWARMNPNDPLARKVFAAAAFRAR